MQPLMLELKLERKRQGMTQRALAKKIGACHSSVNSYEMGMVRPYLHTFVDWANALGYEVRLEKIEKDTVALDWGIMKNPKIDAFLHEIETVCRRHELSIVHEDRHGGFEIESFDEANIEWLKEAADCVTIKE